MSDAYPFLTLEQSCSDAIAWVTRQFCGAGLQVMRTFDLQDARHDPADCPCPYHGTEQCDCQIVVLLVYGEELHPVSLVAHGQGGRTWFSLVDTPQQRADPRLERAIRQVLPVVSSPPLGQVHGSHGS